MSQFAIYLKETYKAGHNARFAVLAAEESSAFVPFVGDRKEVLSVPESRVVSHDNCVR